MDTSLLSWPLKLISPVYQRSSLHRSVIEEVSEPSLRQAYNTCRNITRQYAKTFYLATRFLPNYKQRGVFAIYALCRYIDNLVDEREDILTGHRFSHVEQQSAMHALREELVRVYQHKHHKHPILMAFADTLNRAHIPMELPLELMNGVDMDLSKNRYASFEEVYNYSYKVASVVGLMTVEIFGYQTEEALQPAVDLGIAMQLTNILRDIGEDLKGDRIYLPQNELAEFGIKEKDLFAHKIDANFKAFMRFQVQRARSYYQKGDKGIGLLHRDSRLPVALARYNYCRILDKIEANGFDVFTKRAYLTTSEKILSLPRVLNRIRA